MQGIRRITAAITTALMTLCTAASFTETSVYAEGAVNDVRKVTIDGSKANTKENMLYRGNGMVSANNTSRLLMDYKTQSPKAYHEILEHLFGKDGLGINHLKIEMGSDVNSSSGTEPNIMRTEDEEPDVTRGAGFMLAADAKAINPDLTLDMLYWSEPKWVADSEDVYAARYKWYKKTLDAAYEKYGLVFDYVSATRNERAADYDWIKYLSKSLKEEKDCAYDYSKIKIVAGEEVTTWNCADEMLEDKELRDAIDVIGSHYTSWSTEQAQELADKYGKELWFSEACPPMEYAQGTYRYDAAKTGLTEINGMLDVANRFITMYPGGHMTLCEYQPAVAAYYSGAQYTQKQLIRADEPWSGYYLLDMGYFMGLHFSQFFKKGWAFIDDACFADGVAGGDGHAVVDATYTYMTATDTGTGDYSVAVTNTTDKPITYEFTVKNLEKANSKVNVWETRGPDSGAYDENYFKKTDTLSPTEKDGRYTYNVSVKPYSLVTISTLECEEKDYTNSRESTLLSLPYNDDFEYDDDFLAERGCAPLYTTDQGGAFEVVTKDGSKVLMQKITRDIKADDWGRTPSPTTNFGDDRWFNYSVSADIMIEHSDTPDKNYAGVGLRYNVGAKGESGYRFVVSEDGSWELLLNRKSLAAGTVDNFSPDKNNVKIEALWNNIKVYLNGEQLAEYTHHDNESVGSAGRAALYSSFNKNCFDNLSIEPLGDESYITRYDQTDDPLTYEGSWEHGCMSSFTNYRRTLSKGSVGSFVTIKLNGTGFALTGENKSSGVITLSIDGGQAKELTVPSADARGIVCYAKGLDDGEHTAVITVKQGEIQLDALEVFGLNKKYEAATTTEESNNTESSDKKAVSSKAIAAAALGIAAAGAAAVVIRKRRKNK